jgi:hypothetical protein
MTPLTRLKKNGKFPKLWPTMTGHVLLVRCATKESARPVIAIRTVSQNVVALSGGSSLRSVLTLKHY